MKKRRLIIAGIAASIVGLAIVLLPVVGLHGSGITKTNFDRIEKGMTHTQVDGILGQPGECRKRMRNQEGVDYAIWDWSNASDRTIACILFSDDEIVSYTEWGERREKTIRERSEGVFRIRLW